MVLVNPGNDAFFTAAELSWRSLGGKKSPRRAIAISRVDPLHFQVQLVDISSKDPRHVPIIAKKQVEYFADAVHGAIAELYKDHERQPGDEVVLLHQQRNETENTYRWILVDPRTMEPVNNACAAEYRHV